MVWGSAILLTAAAARPAPDPAGVLRERLSAAPRGEGLICSGESLAGSESLRKFYERRLYEPAWTHESLPRPVVDQMITALAEAWTDGLDGTAYHLDAVRSVLDALREDRDVSTADLSSRLADLDLLLSDAFLQMASHLAAGAVEPNLIEPEWFIQTSRPDAESLLRLALGRGNVASAFEAVRPSGPEYAGLRQALRELAATASRGGWPAFPEGPSIRPGEESSRVEALRRRLTAGGDLPAPSEDGGEAKPALYDADMTDAVRRFQARHGLWVDGVAGPRTQAALAVPAADRLAQVRVNMERWRWLPRDFGPRYIVVNAAAFELSLIEDGASVMEMPVVVGKEANRTPVFDEAMTMIEVNPVWNVPASIASTEILENVKADPEYLARWGYKLYAGWKAGAPEVDPATVDWTKLTADSFPYKVRQESGPLNSLGRLAFLFPNPWSIYLHDTPQRDLFVYPDRSFSHGCIRISRPIDLAVALLGGDPETTRSALTAAIDSGANQIIPLPAPIPIYILYLTAWKGLGEPANFRKDLYGRDAVLARALAGGAAPTPPVQSSR